MCRVDYAIPVPIYAIAAHSIFFTGNIVIKQLLKVRVRLRCHSFRQDTTVFTKQIARSNNVKLFSRLTNGVPQSFILRAKPAECIYAHPFWQDIFSSI